MLDLLLPVIIASGAPAGSPHDHHHHLHTLPMPLPRHAFDPSAAVQPFGLSAVRLLPNSAFAEAQDLNTEYFYFYNNIFKYIKTVDSGGKSLHHFGVHQTKNKENKQTNKQTLSG